MTFLWDHQRNAYVKVEQKWQTEYLKNIKDPNTIGAKLNVLTSGYRACTNNGPFNYKSKYSDYDDVLEEQSSAKSNKYEEAIVFDANDHEYYQDGYMSMDWMKSAIIVTIIVMICVCCIIAILGVLSVVGCIIYAKDIKDRR